MKMVSLVGETGQVICKNICFCNVSGNIIYSDPFSNISGTFTVNLGIKASPIYRDPLLTKIISYVILERLSINTATGIVG